MSSSFNPQRAGVCHLIMLSLGQRFQIGTSTKACIWDNIITKEWVYKIKFNFSVQCGKKVVSLNLAKMAKRRRVELSIKISKRFEAKLRFVLLLIFV
jgi:hypothetical protein